MSKPLRATLGNLKMMATAAAAAATAVGGVLAYSVKLAADAEQVSASFKVFLGSAEKAKAMIADLRKFAAQTPFQFTDLSAAAPQLLGYGFAAEELIDTLRRLGDISAALKLPLNDLIYIYGTSKTQGRLFSRDIMQFQMRGIDVTKELAKVMGVEKEAISELVSEGKVGFEQLEQAIKNMTSEGGTFFGQMNEQSKTLTGRLSNLKDNVESAGIEFGTLVMEGFKLKDVVDALNNITADFGEALKDASPKLKESFAGLNEELTKLNTTLTGNSESVTAFSLGFDMLNAILVEVNEQLSLFNKLASLQMSINKMGQHGLALALGGAKTPTEMAVQDAVLNQMFGAKQPGPATRGEGASGTWGATTPGSTTPSNAGVNPRFAGAGLGVLGGLSKLDLLNIARGPQDWGAVISNRRAEAKAPAVPLDFAEAMSAEMGKVDASGALEEKLKNMLGITDTAKESRMAGPTGTTSAAAALATMGVRGGSVVDWQKKAANEAEKSRKEQEKLREVLEQLKTKIESMEVFAPA